MKRGDIAEPPPTVPAGEAPAWLTEALPTLIAMLRRAIECEAAYPTRPELHRRLGAIERAARLLMKELHDLHILPLLLEGDEQIENANETFHGLRDMARRAARARESQPRRQGRGRLYPKAAIGPSPMELCALMIAAAYYQAQGQWPGQNNVEAHRLCEALWTAAGGAQRLGRGKPRLPSPSKETGAAGSWGKSGSETVVVWRQHLQAARNYRPPHDAGRIIQGIMAPRDQAKPKRATGRLAKLLYDHAITPPKGRGGKKTN